jgi:hypothetical protein
VRPSAGEDVVILDRSNDARLAGRVTKVTASETEVYVSKWDSFFSFDTEGESKLGRFRLFQ